MKRITTSVIMAGFAGVLLSIVFGVSVQAAWSPHISDSESVTVKKDKTHKGSLYATGSTIKIEGDVEGDVYCGAQTVEISGTVGGSVLCGAQDIRITGTIGQGARLAGQHVTIDGSVGGGVSVAAQNMSTSDSASVRGDINGYAQAVTVGGEVLGGLRLAAESVTVNGTVRDSSDLDVASLTFGEKGKFKNSLYYSSREELTVNEDNVAGEITYNQSLPTTPGKEVLLSLALVSGMFLFTGMVIATVFPRFVERSSQRARGKFGATLLAGSAVVFVTPIVAILCMISFFGIFLGVVLLLAWVLTLMLSGVFFAYYLGSIILQHYQNVLLRMFGGLVLLTALCLIPYVQIIAVLSVIVIGPGLLVRAIFDGKSDIFRYNLAAPASVKPSMPTALGATTSTPKEQKIETPQPIAKKTKTKSQKTTTKKTAVKAAKPVVEKPVKKTTSKRKTGSSSKKGTSKTTKTTKTTKKKQSKETK